MYKGKVAIKTPAGNYRIPPERIGHFEFISSATGFFQDFKGDLADRIGAYEDCSTLDELNRIRRLYGLKEIKR